MEVKGLMYTAKRPGSWLPWLWYKCFLAPSKVWGLEKCLQVRGLWGVWYWWLYCQTLSKPLPTCLKSSHRQKKLVSCSANIEDPDHRLVTKLLSSGLIYLYPNLLQSFFKGGPVQVSRTSQNRTSLCIHWAWWLPLCSVSLVGSVFLKFYKWFLLLPGLRSWAWLHVLIGYHHRWMRLSLLWLSTLILYTLKKCL